MSRSRKKTPITGITTATSEKAFKKREHKRERTSAKQALEQGEEPPHTRAFGNPFDGDKDGKRYWPDWEQAKRK